MEKEDLHTTTPTKEEPQHEEASDKDMKDLRLKKRINRITLIITTIAACFVCYLSAERYFNWIIQTVIDRTDVHISEIPFPAVTLCPVMDVYSLSRYFRQEERINVEEFLGSLEKAVPTDDDTSDFNDEGVAALQSIDYDEILGKLYFRCEDFFQECMWRRIKRNCCSLFRKVQYGQRICYAFNSLRADDPDPSWPWSETVAGRMSGLRVVMNTSASEAMLPRVMAMIHYPEEQISSNSLYLKGEVHVSVDALKFFADIDTKQVRADYRHCYFTDEIVKNRKSNVECWKECRVAYIQQVCNCNLLKISTGNKNVKEPCNSSHLTCFLEHRNAFLSNGNIYEKNTAEETTEFVDCKCYPNCNYVQYKMFIRYDLDSCIKLEDSSLVDLEVHFLRDTIFSYRTSMAYNLLDLIVAFCSIVALFLGVSVISVVQAIQEHFEKRRKAKALAEVEHNK